MRSARPQCERCDLCPHNKWGSKINALGNEVKACDDMKKLAWYIPELRMPLMFLMRLKGSSWKNWRAYIQKVALERVGDRKADPVDMVTRIFFDPNQIGILMFDYVGFIDPQAAAIQDQNFAAGGTDQMVGRLDKPRTLALPAPQAQPAVTHQPQYIAPQVPHTAPAPMAAPQMAATPAGLDRVGELEAELARLRAQQQGGQRPAAPATPSQAPTQPAPQNNAPTGFGGGNGPLPAAGGTTFGGPAAGQSPAPTGALASPSDMTSGRPPRAPRKPRAAPTAPPPAQSVPGTAFGGQPGGFGVQQQPPLATQQPQQAAPAPQAPQTPQQPRNFGITPGAPVNADLEAALSQTLNRG